MANKAVTSEKIHLKNVRLSFARLYKAKAFREGQDPRFEATFLLDPSNADHAKTIALIKTTIAEVAKKVYGEIPQGMKHCLVKGDSKGYDGYAGMVAVPTHNKVRPAVVNRKNELINEGEPQAPYSGCFVNGTITLWGIKNGFDPRVSANLRGVQFARDGEAFGVRPVDPNEEFEAYEDEGSSGAGGSGYGSGDEDITF